MYNILCTPCILLLAFMCHTIEYGLQKKMQRTVKIPLLPLSQVSITFLYVRYSPKKVLPVKLFFIHLYISVVLKGLDRAESSDIHGFVAHAWDVKCPSIRKMGASLWISDVIFFHPIPSSSCSTCGQFVRNSEMPLATLNFLETKITWKDCYLKWKKCQQIRSPVLKG